MEIHGQCHVEHHVERPTVQHYHYRSRDEREPTDNNSSRDYEHHYAFMAMILDPNSDALGDDDGFYHAPREPMETPAIAVRYFATEMEIERYEENKNLHTILRKLGSYLQGQHPELLLTMQKMSLFDEMVD